MKLHTVRVYPSAATPSREEQLAWKLAEVATDPVAVTAEVAEMVANRVIDNAAVAIAAINRRPVRTAREQALAHPREGGATLFGINNDRRFSAEWAAWANGTAVRELDMHDTFLAADYSHPADNIPPILAVAQQLGCSGADMVRGHRGGLRNSDRAGDRHLFAQTQERSHRASLPRAGGRDWCDAEFADRDGLSGDPAGGACVVHDPAIAQRGDFQLEGLRPGPCGKTCHRSGRPRHAWRTKPFADL